MNAVQIPTTGTYSVLVGDCSDSNTGGFAIHSQRTNSPGGAATLSFGQTVSGSITLAAQSNTFTFSGTAKDVVDFTVTAMTGTLSPKIRLYGPTGMPVNSASPGFCDGSTIEMNTVTLSLTGTYTALVGDCGDTNTGNYAIFAQRLNNPVGSTPIFWGDTQTGKMASAAQSNTYTFVGSVNNVVQLNMAVTSGSLSPKIRIYNPDLTLNISVSPGFCDGSTVGTNSVTLEQNGTYTVLVGDCGETRKHRHVQHLV